MRFLPVSVGIRVEGLAISRDGRPILSGVSLQIRPGERTALVGPNGGGKTTLIRILLGVLKPEEGRVVFTDEAGREVPRPRIGYLPQRSSLSPNAPLSGLDLVSLCLSPEPGFGRRTPALAEARSALERAGLASDLLARPVGKLSGGQRQRVLLATALAGSPPLFLLDEPDTALDAEGLRTLRRIVADEAVRGSTVVFVTHDTDAMGGADAIFRIDGTAAEAA